MARSPGWSASCLVSCRLITLDLFCYGRGICTYWNRHLLWIQICLPVCSVSGKTTICGLTECLPPHAVPHSSASDQGSHFIAKEVQQWAPLLVLPCSPLVWSNWLERWNGLLKTQLWCRLCGNMWQGQGKAIHAVNQQPIYALFCLRARIHRWNKGWKWQWQQP